MGICMLLHETLYRRLTENERFKVDPKIWKFSKMLILKLVQHLLVVIGYELRYGIILNCLSLYFELKKERMWMCALLIV